VSESEVVGPHLKSMPSVKPSPRPSLHTIKSVSFASSLRVYSFSLDYPQMSMKPPRELLKINWLLTIVPSLSQIPADVNPRSSEVQAPELVTKSPTVKIVIS
jgi:hypothetical protein